MGGVRGVLHLGLVLRSCCVRLKMNVFDERSSLLNKTFCNFGPQVWRQKLELNLVSRWKWRQRCRPELFSHLFVTDLVLSFASKNVFKTFNFDLSLSPSLSLVFTLSISLSLIVSLSLSLSLYLSLLDYLSHPLPSLSLYLSLFHYLSHSLSLSFFIFFLFHSLSFSFTFSMCLALSFFLVFSLYMYWNFHSSFSLSFSIFISLSFSLPFFLTHSLSITPLSLSLSLYLTVPEAGFKPSVFG
jgi:hypothetical protein